MLQSISNKSISFSLIALTAVFYLIISQELNKLIAVPEELDGLVGILFSFNNIVAITVPILTFVFLLVTTKFMLSLIDMKFPKTKAYDLATVIGFCFLPILLHMILFSIGFFLLDESTTIQSLEDFEALVFFNSLNLEDLNNLALMAWVLVYGLLAMALRRFLDIGLLKAIFLVATPTFFVYMFKIGSQALMQ
ncbi:MAG: hypothetical protein ACR2MT_11105 [Aurantibacter sp.]